MSATSRYALTRRPIARILAVALTIGLGLVSACSTADSTGFLVRLSSQLEIERVLLRVYGSSDSLEECIAFDVKSAKHPSGNELPASLGLSPAVSAARGGTVRVSAIAYVHDSGDISCDVPTIPEPDIRAEAIVSYVEGEVLELPLPFTLSCFRSACAEPSVCRYGECVDPHIDVSKLPRVAAGDVEGTGCYAFEGCGAIIAVTPVGACTIAIPSGTPSSNLVPYVTYRFEDGSISGAEFLSASDIVVDDDAQTFRLSTGLCNLVGAGAIQSFGLAVPCAAIDERPVCPSGETPAAPPRDASMVDGTLTDGPPVEASTDATVPDAPRDGTISDGTPGPEASNDAADGSTDAPADAPLDSADDAPADAGTGDGEAGSDAGEDASDGSRDGGEDGATVTPGTCGGVSCCGPCIGTGASARCSPVLGAAASPPVSTNIAISGDKTFWIGAGRQGSQSIVEQQRNAALPTLLADGMDSAFAILAFGPNTAVLRSVMQTNDVSIDFRVATDPQPQVRLQYPLPRRIHSPVVAASSDAIYTMFRDPLDTNGEIGWHVQRTTFDGTRAFTTSIHLDTIGAGGTPKAMAASLDVVLVSFEEPGTNAVVAIPFASGVPSEVAAGLSSAANAIAPHPIAAGSFLYSRPVGNLNTITAVTFNGATFSTDLVTGYQANIQGLVFLQQAGTIATMAVANEANHGIERVKSGSPFETLPYTGTTANASSLRFSDGCLYWEEGAGMDRSIHTFSIPAGR